ncbi:glycosyl transferase family 2 [Desulfovibrio subterraneus]|uniref:glycosyl transferase family 2 n=1 Tax=Desulfovibrio subterraneus TaxID=2718620 RepID=UPI0022B93288|nr:glycosyl transferase family 2 [Desulfovibrio subterraneus]WBF68041.1 glycosyl transferase family 2 [Desulfovibrio subterraneus]
MATGPIFSIITPSTGKRPLALAQAIESVHTAMLHAGLDASAVEMLVGYDGVQGPEVCDYPFLRFMNLPAQGNFGNGIRRILLRVAKGTRIIFLDDDNTLAPEAFVIFGRYPDAELVIARIDVSKAFANGYLPEHVEGRELFRPTNVDPLCMCLSRDLVQNRCAGWEIYEGYESDYRNLVRYYRRARSVAITDDVVGVYDAGRGMDRGGMNRRQQDIESKREIS